VARRERACRSWLNLSRPADGYGPPKGGPYGCCEVACGVLINGLGKRWAKECGCVLASTGCRELSDDATCAAVAVTDGNLARLGGVDHRCRDAGSGELRFAALAAIKVGNEALACVGDCGAVGTVEVSNLVTGVNIDLGLADLSTCPAFDRDGDGNVRINELLQGVQSALNGCAPDAAVCERTAGEALSDCIERANTAQQGCFLGSGPAHACAPDNAEIGLAMQGIDAAVIPACRDAATVRAAGYGPESTPVDLVHRLQSACRADAASLAARSFGGPQAAALATGTAQASTCRGAAHSAATRLMRDDLALYNSCLNSDTCDAAQTETTAASLQQRLADEVNDLCGAGALQGLVAVDAAEFAKRAAVQVRCLTATAHPDSSPLTLDCGPRADLMNAPRGEYVQIVLDSAKYGTRCGDGSDFASRLRLAPEGSPVSDVVVGMQGGGVCITGPDCASRPADLFEPLTDQPPTTGTMSNDPAVSPFADWTKVYLPYCNQDVCIGGGATGNFPEITVYRYGALNVRAALRYVRDELWSELNRTTAEGYQPDHVHALFGGFSAGGFGTLYNYHYLLDDLQWIHTAAYPDAGLALDNGEVLGVGNLGVLLLGDNPPLGWSTRNYLPPYCIAFNCGVGPVLLAATSPRLLEVPEQQFLILSNQIDGTQVATTFFDSIDSWVNEMRQSYCETHALPGVQYFLPAIPQDIHVISPRPELYASRPVDGVLMRDWLASDFSAPATVTDQVEEGDLVQAFPACCRSLPARLGAHRPLACDAIRCRSRDVRTGAAGGRRPDRCSGPQRAMKPYVDATWAGGRGRHAISHHFDPSVIQWGDRRRVRASAVADGSRSKHSDLALFRAGELDRLTSAA
jgi:hypothetical protein